MNETKNIPVCLTALKAIKIPFTYYMITRVNTNLFLHL